jgi:pectate lyase
MRVLIGWVLLAFSGLVAGQSLPAFPGAEGGGALSVGGRGGVVCQVTNLNDSGAGSLRACLNTHNNTQGSRMTVVFRVGGTIKPNSRISITRSNITIAGQTAPGGGILLSMENIQGDPNPLFYISASDVIVRFIRFRGGVPPESIGYLIHFRSDQSSASNVIFDHNSVSWGTRGLWSLTGRENRPLTNVTISRNLMAEGLLISGSKSILLGWDKDMSENTRQIDLHHNIIMNTAQRNPYVSIKESTFINNMVYNWRGGWGFGYGMRGGVTSDIIGNVFKRGPGPAGGPGSEGSGVYYWSDSHSRCFDGATCIPGPPSIYIAGNRFGGQAGLVSDDWPFIQGSTPTSYRRNNPLSSINPRAYPVTVYHVINDNLEEMLLNDVGASKRLDCMGNWVPNRDSVDQRLINQYRNNTGIIPNTPNDVGGFPTIAGGTPCQDTDGDGMPDVWEDAMGLNKNDPSDRNTLHSSGYTMLEMYLNGPMESEPPPPPPCVEPCILRSATGLVNNGTGFNITFPSAPAEGNKLVFIGSISTYLDATRNATISGFTQAGRLVNGDSSMVILTKTAGASEGATYSVSVSGAAEYHSGILLEIQGTNNDEPFNALALTNSLTTLSRTPTVAGVRPITALASDNAPSNDPPSGWGNLITVRPTYHGLYQASRALATDTTTAYSATWGAGVAPVSAIMLINPADYEPPEPLKTIVPPSGLRYVR